MREGINETLPTAACYIPVAPGTRLRIVPRAAPRADPPGTVVIATGRSEFCETYLDCADALWPLNYNTVIFDWRGQGLSTRALRDPQKGHIDSYDEYIRDMHPVIAHTG